MLMDAKYQISLPAGIRTTSCSSAYAGLKMVGEHGRLVGEWGVTIIA